MKVGNKIHCENLKLKKRKERNLDGSGYANSETNESEENICKLVESDDEDDVVSSASSIDKNLIEVDDFVIVRFEGKPAPHFYIECASKRLMRMNVLLSS